MAVTCFRVVVKFFGMLSFNLNFLPYCVAIVHSHSLKLNFLKT